MYAVIALLAAFSAALTAVVLERARRRPSLVPTGGDVYLVLLCDDPADARPVRGAPPHVILVGPELPEEFGDVLTDRGLRPPEVAVGRLRTGERATPAALYEVVRAFRSIEVDGVSVPVRVPERTLLARVQDLEAVAIPSEEHEPQFRRLSADGSGRTVYCPQAALLATRAPMGLRSLVSRRAQHLATHPGELVRTTLLSVLFLAVVLGFVIVVAADATALAGPKGLGLVLAYLLLFGSAPIAAVHYWLYEDRLPLRRAIVVAHVQSIIVYTWFVAAWVAVYRMLFRRDAPEAASAADETRQEVPSGAAGQRHTAGVGS